MEAGTDIELDLNHASSRNRERALAGIARYRTPTVAAVIPVWFGLSVALLISWVPTSRVNATPYVVLMLAISLAWVTAIVIRNNRRIEAVVQLILEGDTHGLAKTKQSVGESAEPTRW